MLNMRDDIGIWKSIPITELIACLQQAPQDTKVLANQVGDLCILRGEKGQESSWTMVGYVDIAEETYSRVREP
jgi:hypothetical protein